MKLSLSWIFDHIAGASWHDIDVEKLVAQFSMTTAEVESFQKVSLDLSQFFLVSVINITDTDVRVFCEELSQEFTMPLREDVREGQLLLVRKEPNKHTYAWARLVDWQSSKDGLLPEFACAQEKRAGLWKRDVQTDDYILELSNTSLTHRPDMWGHRGVAREIAAMLNYSLIDEADLISDIAVHTAPKKAAATTKHPFTIELGAMEGCTRFAALHLPKITYTASFLPMALRLARIDARPLNGIVDTTNYVMFDWSEPLHAFDAQTLASLQLGPRMAKNGETLLLLDGQTVTLSDDDMVIASGGEAVALAGIMGGQTTKVTEHTQSIIVEAAFFDPIVVRRTATRLKKRTDGSTRWEKHLDPNQNVPALQRFIAVLLQYEVRFEISEEIVSLGAPAQPGHIRITHQLIEDALGVTIKQDFVLQTLTKLGMTVASSAGTYEITVPTFRSTKDIQLPEDIIEEVGRFYGYHTIPLRLPQLELKAHSLDHIERRRLAERILAYGACAREVHNYPLYDELFLRTISYNPTDTVGLANPVSENAYRLISSLIPHLMKSVELNKALAEPTRFFEWGRVWKKNGKNMQELPMLAGIFVDHKPVDFYQAKAYLQELFDALALDVVWRTIASPEAWSHPYQTAELVLDGEVIGYAGKLHPKYMAGLGFKDGFIFELKSQPLLKARTDTVVYKPASKYQGSWFDVSMFVAPTLTVAQLQDAIYASDKRIVRVTLTDFFQKEEWHDKRSVTLRFFIQPYDATLTKEELDGIYAGVQKNLVTLGAVIR